MRSLAILLLIGIFCGPARSQNRIDSLFTVQGTVIDNKKAPVPFSTVAVHRQSDSTRLAITNADEKGQFQFDMPVGEYFITVSFLAFNERLVPFSVSEGDVMLGTVTLNPTRMLQEVVVSSEKKLAELKLDKRVYNVSLDVSNIGSNASEILANIPSVTVDVDGNVSLRGSEGVRILIDGKPSAMTGIRGNDALRNLQAAMIDRVEVITNPSSRYDAAGETGIINIILKKNKTRGFNGNFTATTGYPANFSGAYSVNYRTQKMNLFSSFGSSYRNHPGKGFSTQLFSNADTSFIYNRSTNRRRKDFSVDFIVGVDYYLSPNTTLTGSFLLEGGRGNNITEHLYEDFDQAGGLINQVLRIDDEKEREADKEVTLTFRKKFDPATDHELTADFKWTNSGETETSDYEQVNLMDNETTLQRSGNPAYEDNLLLQTDYVHPFAEDGKLEAGFKGTVRQITNEYLVEQRDASGGWTKLPAFDNDMEFVEKIYAAYAMLGNKHKDFSWQTGLRGEWTVMRTGLLKTNDINRRNYFNLFPSASLSYELNDRNTVQLSYSYRINRPHFRNLTPFADYSDPRVFFVGNPGLAPEYTHSSEAGYLFDWGKGSLFSTVYYRHKTGVVERIRVLDSAGITNIIPINLSTQDDIGAELVLSFDLSEVWKLNSNFNFYHARAKGSFNGQSLGSSTSTWTNRTMTRVTLFKKLDAQASVFYRSPRNTTQGRDLSVYWIDLGLAKDVFKGKGTLTFNVRDLTNNRRWRSIVDIPGYYSESEFQGRPRQFNLTLNFRVNQQKIQPREENRMEENGFEN